MKYDFVGTKTEMNKSARRGAQLVPIGMLAAASRVHRFLELTKETANPCRIGDRLV
jgi:hypothetical protein